ncbi:MAG TPA: short chain dehydrogenase [Rhodospirillaceae bacterium]|jgi:3-oxoacyl-[acyl-carrier protein] reductase|nr:3-oxoacyl-ACP reductase [Rhodospirillaceae bacterium]MBB56992.1 3-oxoacyl-ACP reductase [Rhodospirillaceae bacterium]HAJ19383.1 short chain dehydrogenase [Rhodospirillaceae bacterium]HBM13987.1 short chain dehydrogenase [Rhodospirillaceae bacterium]|tara:strand:+ start:13025 stop:13771 length:747 start_codon:yes stop_codon:yes gene_type:complete
MRLNNKVAIVTGAASGFGEGIARRFAAEGAKVVVADITEDAGQTIAADIGDAAHFIRADVTSAADWKALVDGTIAHFGRLDIVVNNAGYTHLNQPMLDVQEAEFDRVYAVNVKSLYLSAQAAVPVFRNQGSGQFLNIASTAGIRPRPGLVWYNSSKSAAIGITRSMAIELAAEQIRVNAINPVAGETPLLKRFMGQDTPEKRAAFKASIPMGRLSTAQDIAGAAVYLCSDDAALVTGVCMEVDGGRCI